MPSLCSTAKINLFLEITGKRGDGFHDLESLFLEVTPGDDIAAEERGKGIFSLECNDKTIPVDDSNLALRAARLLASERLVNRGIHFTLNKRLPMGGGLGGGSSNAAAALRLADELWDTRLSRQEMHSLAERLGSDVPFFLHGGFCLVHGRGERIAPLPAFPSGIAITLVTTNIHSNTAAAFRGLVLPEAGAARGAGEFMRAAAARDVAAMTAAAFNRFEPTLFAAIPELGEVHDRLEDVLGVPVRLSGSGSGMWFFGDAAQANEGVASDKTLSLLAEKLDMRLEQAVPVRRENGCPEMTMSNE